MTEKRASRPGGFLLWFALLGPPLAWLVHFMLSYPLVALACFLGGQAVLLVFTGLMSAVNIAAGVVAWRFWRTMSVEERGILIDHMEGTRVGFMVYAGLLASGIFLLAIILETIPIFFVNPCTPVGII